MVSCVSQPMYAYELQPLRPKQSFAGSRGKLLAWAAGLTAPQLVPSTQYIPQSILPHHFISASSGRCMRSEVGSRVQFTKWSEIVYQRPFFSDTFRLASTQRLSLITWRWSLLGISAALLSASTRSLTLRATRGVRVRSSYSPETWSEKRLRNGAYQTQHVTSWAR